MRARQIHNADISCLRRFDFENRVVGQLLVVDLTEHVLTLVARPQVKSHLPQIIVNPSFGK